MSGTCQPIKVKFRGRDDLSQYNGAALRWAHGAHEFLDERLSCLNRHQNRAPSPWNFCSAHPPRVFPDCEFNCRSARTVCKVTRAARALSSLTMKYSWEPGPPPSLSVYAIIFQ